jgi:hypothetical protein
VAPRVADFDLVLALVARQLQHRLVVAHLFRAEVDDAEPVAVVAVLAFVVQMRLVPVYRRLEVADTDHRVIE